MNPNLATDHLPVPPSATPFVCLQRIAPTSRDAPTEHLAANIQTEKHSGRTWNRTGSGPRGSVLDTGSSSGSSQANFVILNRSRLVTARRLSSSLSPSLSCRVSTVSSSGKPPPFPPCHENALASSVLTSLPPSSASPVSWRRSSPTATSWSSPRAASCPAPSAPPARATPRSRSAPAPAP